jgi:predicted secreted protein
LTDPASPTDVTLRPDGKLVVRLTSNPTTGYYWSQISGDGSIVALISEGYLADPAPAGMVGTGGTQEFTFNAIRKGRTEIVLSYQRHESDVADTLNLKVKVIE